MAKKVRFPLKIGDNQVRTLEELREHFDLAAVMSYYVNGRLAQWLEDRYYESEAEEINALDSSAQDFKNRLCDILGVDYAKHSGEVNLAQVSAENERRERLKTFTADDKILAAADRVAFSQEELADLLDNNVSEIYLCGDRFTIPGSKADVKYIGVDNPEVVISSNLSKNIVFHNVRFNTDDFMKLAEAGSPEESAKWLHKAADAGSGEAHYRLGFCYYKGQGVETDYFKAEMHFVKASDLNHEKAKKLLEDFCFENFQCIAGNHSFVAGLKTDGAVIAVAEGSSYKIDYNIDDWRDITAIGVMSGTNIIGLKPDGTVITAKESHGTDQWRNIVAISASSGHSSLGFVVGLKEDGTVVAAGENNRGQCNVQDWRDITDIATGANHTVGLKKDGTVVAVGYNGNYGWYPSKSRFSFKLPEPTELGNVNGSRCDVQHWRDIIAIAAGGTHTLGLKSDGTVIAAGYRGSAISGAGTNLDIGQCNTQNWTDIISIAAYWGLSVALKKDGTVITTSSLRSEHTQNWRDIIAIFALNDDMIIGLKKDGTLCDTFDGSVFKKDNLKIIRDWKNIGVNIGN